LLGASALNRVRHIVKGTPSALIGATTGSPGKLQIEAMEKAFTKLTHRFQR
jgi:hypothetical protein